MRRIGLLGGMSWESTRPVLPAASTSWSRERLGGLHSADCLLCSVDFADIEGCRSTGAGTRRGRARRRRRRRAGGGRRRAGAVHQHHAQGRRPDRRPPSPIPLLHIADATAAAVAATPGSTRSGCWAPRSRWSRTSTASVSQPTAWACWCPTPRTGQLVHRVIYDELCLGIVRDESREALPGRAGGPGHARARRASCSAARSSSCCSARRTARCRSSRPPRSTSRPPSSRPSGRSVARGCPAPRAAGRRAAPPAT